MVMKTDLLFRRPSPGGWVAHGFSRGGRELTEGSCPPPLKRRATRSSMTHRISRGLALVRIAVVLMVLAPTALAGAAGPDADAVVMRIESGGGLEVTIFYSFAAVA